MKRNQANRRHAWLHHAEQIIVELAKAVWSNDEFLRINEEEIWEATIENERNIRGQKKRKTR